MITINQHRHQSLAGESNRLFLGEVPRQRLKLETFMRAGKAHAPVLLKHLPEHGDDCRIIVDEQNGFELIGVGRAFGAVGLMGILHAQA